MLQLSLDIAELCSQCCELTIKENPSCQTHHILFLTQILIFVLDYQEFNPTVNYRYNPLILCELLISYYAES